jgi:RimJ/RimL family protein N-acetyltransferase
VSADGGFVLAPVALEGDRVRLEPVERRHLDGLLAAAAHEDLWTWMPIAIDSRPVLEGLIDRARANAANGTGLSLVTHVKGGDGDEARIVGATSYLNVDPPNRRLEIGFTWVTPAWQRTFVNTEAKYLMFRHAFETLGCERVELKTDARNRRSREAILRIGATEEGTLRHHMLRRDGSFRDSVYFSVLRSEWPDVKSRLESRLSPSS